MNINPAAMNITPGSTGAKAPAIKLTQPGTDGFRPGEDFGIVRLEAESGPKRPGPNAKLSTVFTGERVSEKAETLSWLMDESKNIEEHIGFNLSPRQLAGHIGDIGRQIDGAFAAGEITGQERDELNAGLERYSENVTSQAERRDAMWGVMRQMAASTRAMVESGASDEEMAAYAKKNMDSMQERISEFVKKHTAIDRGLMAELIAKARVGMGVTAFQVEAKA